MVAMDQEWLDEKPPPGSSHSRVVYSRNESARSMVIGSSKLYEDGTLRLVPMPTPDPKDPLNLPTWRKWLAIAVVCYFGGLAFAAERGISALLPVFVLEYANEDTHLINGADFAGASAGNPAAVSPLAAMPFGAAGTAAAAARLDRVALITTVVRVADSLASLVLVPLSAAVGRRPAMLLAVAVAVAGWLWAALSRSLTQHLIARGMQGFGGGALEALVPLIVTDLLFVHQRNAAMAAVMASQGVLFAAIGFAAPYIAAHYDWRVVYFVITGLGFLALVLVAGLLPETRWSRSDEELSGQRLWPIREGDDRPEPDFNRYSAPRLSTYVGLFQNGIDFREIPAAYLGTLRALACPAVLWGILANTIFLVAADAASQLSTDALLARGWSFQDVGLATGLPFFGASLLVMAVNGPVADEMANAITRRNAGRREPEQHLASAMVPFLAGVAGCFVVGVAAQQGLHWSVLLVGALLVVYGGMAVATLVNVLVAESYPAWAGAALANVSSLRVVAAFFFSGGMQGFPLSRGLLATYAVFAEIMIVASLGIPVLYFFGRRFRSWTAGRVYAVRLEKRSVDDGASI